MKRTPMDFFEAISAIPRTSGNEAAAADFVEALAKEHGYSSRRDSLHNVTVVKPAGPGMENAETFMLQGHLDMVGEAVPGSSHDFLKDPVKLIIEGDIMRADGTTLGADNGIAIAYMLAIMDDEALRHPRLELVFTTQEEVGLVGAAALDCSGLTATRMINMDGGPEGTNFVSCAGGTYVSVESRLESEPALGNIIRIDIDGLTSGHSGLAINQERANAIVLCGIIADALRKMGGRLVSLSGGDKDNVIPGSASLKIAIEKDPEKLLNILRGNMLKTWEVSDPGMNITWKPDSSDTMLNQISSDCAVDLLLLAPHGVMSMSSAMPGLVESSCNLASVRIGGNDLSMSLSIRSSSPMRAKQLIHRVERLAGILGAKANTGHSYPGWAYEPVSPLRDKCKELETRIFGAEPVFSGIHAGLECGILKSAMPQLDIVATGPTYMEAHTPDEWMSISSFNRFYEFLLTLLAES